MNFDQRESNEHPRSFMDKVTIAVAEFLATAIMVFIACMGCVPGFHSEGYITQQSALTSGLAVLIVIFIFGHVSKAHVNPLTSVAAVIVGEIKLPLLPVYVTPQILGAVTGYGLLMAITPSVHLNSTTKVCVTLPNPALTITQAIIAEFLLSLVLTLSNCSGFDIRNKDNANTASINYGFIVATLIMTGGPYTGAGMNPAKSFAAALWNNIWKDHWIYWLAPMTASVVGSLCYRLIFLRNISSSKEITIGSRHNGKNAEHIPL